MRRIWVELGIDTTFRKSNKFCYTDTDWLTKVQQLYLHFNNKTQNLIWCGVSLKIDLNCKLFSPKLYECTYKDCVRTAGYTFLVFIVGIIMEWKNLMGMFGLCFCQGVAGSMVINSCEFRSKST